MRDAYEEWAVYIKGKLEENGIYSQNSTVAELGCGTGAGRTVNIKNMGASPT